MDNLQTLWRNAQPKEDDSGISANELNQITQQKSQQEFDRFKKTILWEMIANIPVAALFIYWFTTIEALNNLLILSLTALVFATYMVWQYLFYKKIQLHTPQDDVQTYLAEGLSLLKHYLRIYQLIIVFSIVFGGFIGHWIVRSSEPGKPPLLFSGDVTLNLIYSILFATALFLAAHFYIKYAYKNRISRMQRYQEKSKLIKQLVAELRKEE